MKISLEGGGGSPDKIKSQHTRTKEEGKSKGGEKAGDASPMAAMLALIVTS